MLENEKKLIIVAGDKSHPKMNAFEAMHWQLTNREGTRVAGNLRVERYINENAKKRSMQKIWAAPWVIFLGQDVDFSWVYTVEYYKDPVSGEEYPIDLEIPRQHVGKSNRLLVLPDWKVVAVKSREFPSGKTLDFGKEKVQFDWLPRPLPSRYAVPDSKHGIPGIQLLDEAYPESRYPTIGYNHDYFSFISRNGDYRSIDLVLSPHCKMGVLGVETNSLDEQLSLVHRNYLTDLANLNSQYNLRFNELMQTVDLQFPQQ